MKLFVIYIGGAHEKSLIELHDIRLIVADKIEDTMKSLEMVGGAFQIVCILMRMEFLNMLMVTIFI